MPRVLPWSRWRSLQSRQQPRPPHLRTSTTSPPHVRRPYPTLNIDYVWRNGMPHRTVLCMCRAGVVVLLGGSLSLSLLTSARAARGSAAMLSQLGLIESINAGPSAGRLATAARAGGLVSSSPSWLDQGRWHDDVSAPCLASQQRCHNSSSSSQRYPGMLQAFIAAQQQQVTATFTPVNALCGNYDTGRPTGCDRAVDEFFESSDSICYSVL